MTLTEDDIRHVALLGRLHLEDEEISMYAKDLGKIFTHVELLNQLDTSAVVPTSHPRPAVNVLRDDVAQAGLSTEAALSNAPQKEANCFKVPQLI